MRRWFSSGINPVVQAFGRRPEGRIGIAKAVELPKALADIINGIGLHIGQGGALKFIPRPEDNPGQAADRLQVRADYNILANFAHLVQDAKSAGHIRTGSTSSQELGTAWWVISGRKSEDPSEVAAVAESVRIDSAFPEFTPSDALLCAIVERQNTGLEDNTDILLKWTFGEVENVPSIRVAYNIQACPDLTEAVYASVDRSLIYKDQSGSSYFPYNSTPVESGVAATIGTPTLSGILEAGPSHEPDATGVPTDSAIPESENPLQEPVTFKPTTTGPTKPMAESTKWYVYDDEAMCLINRLGYTCFRLENKLAEQLQSIGARPPFAVVGNILSVAPLKRMSFCCTEGKSLTTPTKGTSETIASYATKGAEEDVLTEEQASPTTLEPPPPTALEAPPAAQDSPTGEENKDSPMTTHASQALAAFTRLRPTGSRLVKIAKEQEILSTRKKNP
ncbi:unnamed protein product [Bemisia tabaci]|uniref:Uncharacterized protein n=1 Tax=Bemisia tabaci TaxID=7038 RepID=A0A9P0AL20_BEMTA|nr:unnamed protein product [Bemisia tabaci]